jgi:hypothetical protein
MKTLKLTASTKKGETQNLRFLIQQDIPYPDIAGDCGRLAWRNAGGLFGQYGSPARGIGENYICSLLADTAPDVVPDDYNRTILAGYADYHDQTKINGGTFKLRGRDLGEMTIKFEGNPDYQNIKVHGFDAPSTGERAAIAEFIVPALRQFITDNRAELKAEAVANIKARFSAELEDARIALKVLEDQAETATF